MRKINDLGKRAAALALAAGLALSTVPPVLAADTEADTPPAQTQQQEQDVGGYEPIEESELKPADDGIELYAAGQCSNHTYGPVGTVLSYPLPDTVTFLWWKKEPSCTERGVAHVQCKTLLGKYILGQYVTYNCSATADRTVERKPHSYGEWIEKAATCESPSRRYQICSVCGDEHGDPNYTPKPKLDHDWDEGKIQQEFPCVKGTKIFTCKREGCGKTKTEDVQPTAPHTPGEWEVLAAPTCTQNGKRVKKCTECGEIRETDTESEDMKALDHDFEGAEWVEEAATCTTPGQRYQVCQREGCSERNLDTDYMAAHPKLGHALSEFVDDNKPGCQQQTATAHCTREGCSYTEHKDLKNFGPDDTPRPHRFTHWVTVGFEDGTYAVTRSACDYGCGTVQRHTENLGMSANVGTADAAAGAVDQKIADTINDAVKQMQQDVNNAETKEEATKALANFKNVAADALVANIKIDNVGITRDQALNLLNKAIPSLDGIESTLNDSFLSKETIQATVNKLADTITSTEGTNATKDVAYKMAFNIVFDKLDKTHTANSDPEGQAKGLAGTLSSMLVGQDTDWDQLTDTLVNDAVELALDELMKDKKVARLLKTKLGAETVDELRVEIKKQLVEDPTFMNNVRTQVKTATDNATDGINKGWSDEKVLLGMRRDLLPITDLISSQVSKLGDSAEQIANKKVEDTVHKFLPGKLGDWVSNKINEKVSPTVQNEVQKLGNQATDMVTTFIKQFTCTHKWSEDMELRAATCTEKGQRGKVCTKCGKTKDKYDTDPLNHVEVIDPAVEPTETATGLTEGSHCSRCGAVLTAQKTVSMLDPTIYSQFERADITPAEAEQAGYDSVEAACAALDAALTQAGFDPASAEHFALQVNSSIGALPADRFPRSGVTGTLSVPAAAGKAKTFYVVQLYTARSPEHEAGDIVVTPVEVWGEEMTLTVCGRTITAIAWKAE